MKSVTYEGTIEDGRVKLPETVRLPEHTKVLVIVPGDEAVAAPRIQSPRLAYPEQARDFVKQLQSDSPDARIR